MELQLSLLFFVEAVGTIAFASSGAMVAIKKQLDLLGVIVLGVTTAVGGGMLRERGGWEALRDPGRKAALHRRQGSGVGGDEPADAGIF